MKKTIKLGSRPAPVSLNYQLVRNLTCPEEKENGVQTYVANLPMKELSKLNTDSNLRDYIGEYSLKRRNGVHRAIRSTLETTTDRFINRNSGITITCSSITIDDANKFALLKNASLINGAQTQGEIAGYLLDIGYDDNPDLFGHVDYHVRAEIIVDPDIASVTETAIARNTSTPVKTISQAGARGQLDELELSIQSQFKGVSIRKSETDPPEFLETQQILQQCRLLMPSTVSGSESDSETLKAYKNRAQCLSDFTSWYDLKDSDEPEAERYRFTVEIAPHAINEYEYWLNHPYWNKMRIHENTKKGGRAVRRDPETKLINWISPGVLYPVLSAMRVFTLKDNGHWTIKKPDLFNPEEMIERAASQFRAHNSDPMAMGRSSSAYDALQIYPRTLMQVIKSQEASK